MGKDDEKRIEDQLDREPVFYYSREHRLSKASSAVRDLNESKAIKGSIARSLFGNKGNLFVLATILAICAMFSIVSRNSSGEKSVIIGGNNVILAVIRAEELNILDIVKTVPKGGDVYTGAVDIAVSPVLAETNGSESMQAFFHRVFFTPAGNESFRLTLPFEGSDFLVILRTENEQKSLRIGTNEKK